MFDEDTFKQQLRLIGTVAAVLTAVFGASVLIGRVLGLDLLAGETLGIAVKTNTGAAFLFAGTALLLTSKSRNLPGSPSSVAGYRAAVFLSALVFFIGALTLAQHLTGLNMGIDELITKEAPGAPATTSPNRMGPPASVSFTLIGIALVLLNSTWRHRDEIASQLGFCTAIYSALPILGYLFGARELYGVAHFTGIALPSAVAILLLSSGIIASCNSSRFIGMLTAHHAGGFLVRRLLLPAIIIPPVLGYLRTLGEQAELFDAPFGRSLLILAFILVFASLVRSNAEELAVIDAERRELLDSERTARSQAEHANKLKDEFLATLSHELRTPLNAILGWSQLMKRLGKNGPEVSKGLDTIERNARLQAQLIDDLLDLSRIISGKLRLHFATVDLNSVLAEAMRTIELSAKEKDIQIEQVVPESATLTAGDADRLQQVFWNILANAVKFTPVGGKIQTNVTDNGSTISVQIKDTGCGMEPELLARVFDRFRQGDGSTTRRHGGLGIGLSVAHELVSLHHGTIRAASPGRSLGSTFTIELPSVVVEGRDNAIPSTDAYPSLGGPELDGITVLVVEDEQDTRDLVVRILEHSNAKVVSASSVVEALILLESIAPDILISDIGMPHQDGYQLIKSIRAHKVQKRAKIPAIALTAFAQNHEIQRSIESGFSAHLSKPVDTNELIGAVHKLTRSPTSF